MGWRTHHGIVQERTTVAGAPVAVVTQRSTYGREVDSALGFARFNDPGFLTGPEAFARAAAQIDYTFTWFYLDDADISYFSSGRLPLRWIPTCRAGAMRATTGGVGCPTPITRSRSTHPQGSW